MVCKPPTNNFLFYKVHVQEQRRARYVLSYQENNILDKLRCLKIRNFALVTRVQSNFLSVFF